MLKKKIHSTPLSSYERHLVLPSAFRRGFLKWWHVLLKWNCVICKQVGAHHYFLLCWHLPVTIGRMVAKCKQTESVRFHATRWQRHSQSIIMLANFRSNQSVWKLDYSFSNRTNPPAAIRRQPPCSPSLSASTMATGLIFPPQIVWHFREAHRDNIVYQITQLYRSNGSNCMGWGGKAVWFPRSLLNRFSFSNSMSTGGAPEKGTEN